MPLQLTGQISMLDIAGQYGLGNSPTNISFALFYRGGSYVAGYAPNNNIPASGQISINAFYGAVRYSNLVSFSTSSTFTVPTNVQTLSLTLIGAGGGSGGSYESGSTATAGSSGSGGAIVSGSLAVTPGQTYTVTVGVGGTYGSQSWNGGGGGTGGSGYNNGSNGGASSSGAGGGGGSSAFYLNTTIVQAAGGTGGGGTGSTGGAGGGTNTLPSGFTQSGTQTNGGPSTDNSQPSSAKSFQVYYSTSYGTGGSGALSGANSALTGVPDYSSCATSVPTNNGNGGDFIITVNLKGGYGGFACYRTQAQQGGAFYATGSGLSIYAGKTVSGVNTSGNGGSSFWIMGPDIYNSGGSGSVSVGYYF